jgi:hypothetical protein
MPLILLKIVPKNLALKVSGYIISDSGLGTSSMGEEERRSKQKFSNIYSYIFQIIHKCMYI